jgi:CBS domain-containing protein
VLARDGGRERFVRSPLRADIDHSREGSAPMRVHEAMARTISTVRPEDTLGTAADLMKSEDCGFLPVVQDEILVGVVTDRDVVLRALADASDQDPRGRPVGDVMTTAVWSIGPEDDLAAAAETMARHGVRRLPVVEGDVLRGVLSHGNLTQALDGEGAAREATLGVTQGA